MPVIVEHKFMVVDITDGLKNARERAMCNTREEAEREIDRTMKITDGPEWVLTIWEIWEQVWVKG